MQFAVAAARSVLAFLVFGIVVVRFGFAVGAAVQGLFPACCCVLELREVGTAAMGAGFLAEDLGVLFLFAPLCLLFVSSWTLGLHGVTDGAGAVTGASPGQVPVLAQLTGEVEETLRLARLLAGQR